MKWIQNDSVRPSRFMKVMDANFNMPYHLSCGRQDRLAKTSSLFRGLREQYQDKCTDLLDMSVVRLCFYVLQKFVAEINLK